MRTINRNYPFNIWLSSIGLGSVLIIITMMILDSSTFHPGLILLLLYIVFFALLVSLPTLLVFYLLWKDIARSSIPCILKKVCFAIIPILGLCLTFYFIRTPLGFTEVGTDEITIPALYSISIIISVVFIPLYKKEILVEEFQ